MLNISKELQAALLTDGTHKNLTLEFENTDFSRVNFWHSSLWTDVYEMDRTTSTIYKTIFVMTTTSEGSDHYKYLSDAKYLFISADIKLVGFDDKGTGASPATVSLFVSNGVTRLEEVEVPFSTITSDFVHYEKIIDTSLLTTPYFDLALRDSSHNFISKNVQTVINSKNIQIFLGDEEDAFPYLNAQQVEYNGGDIDDYITIYDEQIDPITNNAIEKESMKMSESICSTEELTFGACEGAEFECVLVNDSHSLAGRYVKPFISVDGIDEKIPLGRYRISSEKKTQVSKYLTKKRIEAYDGMHHFDKDASSWFDGYMGASRFLTFVQGGKQGYQITRQMFSTFYNICKYSGINLEFTKVGEYSPYQALPGIWDKIPLNENGTEYIGYHDVEYHPNLSNGNYFRINLSKIYDYAPVIKAYFEDYMTQQNGFKSYKDYGMSPSNGGVFIMVMSGVNPIYFTSVNDGDVFYLSSDFQGLDVHVLLPVEYVTKYNNQTIEEDLTWPSSVSNLKLEQFTFNLFNHPNNGTRLVYYNWETLELASGLGMSERDILRSLIELTGGFLRYGRDGKFEFVRPSKRGLYPSNTLYPSDDLYPRKASDATLAMTKYRSIKYQDYKVANYGKIQIVGGDVKTYDAENDGENTYLIDSNVFYSDSSCIYKTDYAGRDIVPEVEEMLENLMESIENLTYIPHDTITIGLPWIECGDRIRIKSADGMLDTFIFERALDGIQVLTDRFSAEGENQTEQVSEYEWR